VVSCPDKIALRIATSNRRSGVARTEKPNAGSSQGCNNNRRIAVVSWESRSLSEGEFKQLLLYFSLRLPRRGCQRARHH
jgi:hypothetical protein